MRVFSTFTGIGGFELGIQDAYRSTHRRSEEDSTRNERQGLLTEERQKASPEERLSSERDNNIFNERPLFVGYSEIDRYACSVYERHFKTDRTAEEIKADLDSIKTILSDENYGMLEVCYVNTAESGQTFIKTTNQSVETALKDTSLSGDSKIRQLINNTKKGLELCSDNECLICTEMSVSAVESQSQSFSHLNTEMVTDILTEKNMELAICINSPSKFTTQKNTKSYATTVITLKEGTAYAHINREKPIRNFGDITTIDAGQLPDFDLLVGGFPCQAFSIAGKRQGFQDTRGTLFFDLARILQAKQPRYFIFENVKGLLSHDDGQTFKTIIEATSELGYDCQWQVLNSKDFGVPQNRERVFIVGHRRETKRPDVFPLDCNYGNNKPTITEKMYYLQEDVASYARELVLGMAQQQREKVSREQMQELFKRTQESMERGESREVASEDESLRQQPERDIQEIETLESFLGSADESAGVLGVVSIPTESMLLLWHAREQIKGDTRQVQQQDISADSGQARFVETLRTDECRPLLLAVQPYKERLFYSIGDGRNWAKLYSIKMEDIRWEQQANTLASVLEDNPDQKYFLSPEQTAKLVKQIK